MISRNSIKDSVHRETDGVISLASAGIETGYALNTGVLELKKH